MDINELEGAARDLKGKMKDGYGGLTGDTSTQVDGKIDQAAGKVQARFGGTVDQVNEAAAEAARKAAELAGDAGSAIRNAAKTVREEAKHAGEAVMETGARAGQAVGRTVQQQPLLSLIGVAAIGYLVSFLIHSPSSPLTPARPEPRYMPKLASRYLR
jgi:uncharacterized protein YjbJ (UPF0337 family)